MTDAITHHLRLSRGHDGTQPRPASLRMPATITQGIIALYDSSFLKIWVSEYSLESIWRGNMVTGPFFRSEGILDCVVNKNELGTSTVY